MALDTPAAIAVIGAGPIGIEAALYARFLGYDVQVFERDSVGANLLKEEAQQHRRPVGRCCSPLGLRALMAQDPRYEPPPLETLWTPRELVENYLSPLARTDLLEGSVAEQTIVLSVRRLEQPADPELAEEDAETSDAAEPEGDYEELPPRLPPLRVIVGKVEPAGSAPAVSELGFDADIVIDATGDHGAPFLANLAPCGDPAMHGAAAELVLSEPNFYILGRKSRAGEPPSEVIDGLKQIRSLFALIGGRAGLDLYR